MLIHELTPLSVHIWFLCKRLELWKVWQLHPYPYLLLTTRLKAPSRVLFPTVDTAQPIVNLSSSHFTYIWSLFLQHNVTCIKIQLIYLAANILCLCYCFVLSNFTFYSWFIKKGKVEGYFIEVWQKTHTRKPTFIYTDREHDDQSEDIMTNQRT